MTCCFDLHHYCQISQYQNHRLKYAIHPDHIRVSPSFYMFFYPNPSLPLLPIPTATSQKFSHLLSFFYPYPLYQSCIQTNNESHLHVQTRRPKFAAFKLVALALSKKFHKLVLAASWLSGPQRSRKLPLKFFHWSKATIGLSRYFLPLDQKKKNMKNEGFTPQNQGYNP